MTKTFKNEMDTIINPAMQFISQPVENHKEMPEKIPEGFKMNKLYIEKNSRCLQLFIHPSLYEKLKAKAIKNGSSVNETLHTILSEALNKG